ncbi:metallophosphoesterase family protein [Metabacillus niabensis]|uniref:metallophosphoesterase family protein n=1 Tax=Metabacillus niabensis TaxID=324854 RepID=UPI0039A21F9E
MKVLIMSDSHGLTKEIEEIKNRHKDEVSLMLHCGDSELSHESLELASLTVVKGNCDFGADFPNDVICDINGSTLYLTHGHLYQVKSTLLNLKYRALEVGARFVCYGHSHIANAEMIDGMIFINPGSIRLPVLRRQKTYAILEVENSIANVTFFEVNGTIVENLSQQFSL